MKLKEYLDKHMIDKKKFCGRASINSRTLEKMLNGRDIYLSIALKIYYATDGCVDPFDLRPENSASDRIRKAHLGKKRVSKNSSKDITEQQQQQNVGDTHAAPVELPPLPVLGTGNDQLPTGSVHLPPAVE